uniref:Uncharacterized protein n=1 Tax=Arundo donax TaxID=35708 RepID=A0A0A9FWF3_ARUDO
MVRSSSNHVGQELRYLCLRNLSLLRLVTVVYSLLRSKWKWLSLATKN